MSRNLAIWFSVAFLAPAVAQTPLGTAFTYQGRLKESGVPADDTYDLRFTLFDAPSAGNQVGSTQCHDGIAPVDGLFSVTLDFGAAAFNGDALWLEIGVRSDATSNNCVLGGAYTVLATRQPLTAAPFALYALNGSGDSGLWAASGSTIHNTNAGDVGIGTTAPVAKLHVEGGRGYFADGLNVGASFASPYKILAINQTENAILGKVEADSGAFGYGVYGQSDSASGGGGVFGIAPIYGMRGLAVGQTGTARGGEFTSQSTDGEGVFGYASADTGINYGVRGRTDSPSGFGGYFEGRGYFSGRVGIGTNSPSYSLHVESSDTRAMYVHNMLTSGFTYGVYGQVEAIGGTGIYGIAPAASGAGTGVYGRSESTTGFGVFGFGASTTGANYGVYGRTDSTTGRGVYGRAEASTGAAYGVHGRSDSTNGRGVFGECADNVAVYGLASSLSGSNYGIYGLSQSTEGFGVYGQANGNGSANFGVYGFNGNPSSFGVYAGGRLGASGTKSFRIDHPSDPQNKYLLHYCAEGPEPLNVYSGTARLDEQGQAWVELPAYFGDINRDPRIQLTPAGASMPELYAAEEITDNRFQISGGRAGGKVYWRVEAVRDDAWMRAYGAPVETEKTGRERGKYQHPELYGQPREMGINHNPSVESSELEPEKQVGE